MARTYDRLTSNINYQERGAYFHQIFLDHQKLDGILVDLACGTGALSEYFAHRGYDVIGVDASEEMLMMAQQKKGLSGSNPMYLCQPMQALDLFGTVDIVLCALDSLNHLTDLQELKQTLQRICLFLNPNGLFVFDVNTVYKHQQVLYNQVFVYDCEDVYCVWQNTLRENNIVDIELDIFEYGHTSDSYVRTHEEFSERAYPIETLKAVLDEADLSLIHLYAGDTFDCPHEQTQRIVGVCTNRICKNSSST